MSRISLVIFLFAAPAFPHPGAAIAVASDGRVFFVDTGTGIYSIGRDGRVVRQEGPAFHWFAFDPQNRFARTAWPRIPNAEFRSVGGLVLSSDFPVTIGSDGVFYYPEAQGERVTIVGIRANGTKSARAVVPAAKRWLNGLAAGPDDSLYYTEDAAVRRIDASGRVSAVAARVAVPNCVTIPGIGPELRPYLRGLAVGADGSVYVAASGCGAVVKIDASGRVTTILRTASPWSPTAVALANGDVYVLEYLHTVGDDRRQWLPRVRKITRTGVVTLYLRKGTQ